MKFGFVFTLFLFVATFIARAADFPEWTLNPPSDDRLWFYSVGADTDVNDARKNALAELTSRLAVTIQSTSQQFVSSANSNSSEATADFYLDIDTKQKSNQYTFNRVEVVRQFYDEQHQTFYVLTRINKDVFFEQLHNQLLERVNRLKPDSELAENKAVSLEKLIKFNCQKRSLIQDLALLKAYQQDAEQIDLYLTLMQKQFGQLAAATPLKLISSNTVNLTSIKNWLSQAGFNLATTNKNNQLTLFVSDINQWQGEDEFQFANKQNMQLAFVYQGNVLQQQTISSIAFANDQRLANKKAEQLLNKQLNTN